LRVTRREFDLETMSEHKGHVTASSHGNRHVLISLLRHGTPGQRRDAAARIARALRASRPKRRGRPGPLGGSVPAAARALGLSARRLREILQIPEVLALVEKSTGASKKSGDGA
jgi:hypothetical protein